MKRCDDPFHLDTYESGKGYLHFIVEGQAEIDIEIYHEGLTLEDLANIYSMCTVEGFADEKDMFYNWSSEDTKDLYEEDPKLKCRYLIAQKKKELLELEEQLASL